MNIATIGVPVSKKPTGAHLPAVPGQADRSRKNFEAMRLIGLGVPDLDDAAGHATVTHDSGPATEQASAGGLPEAQSPADIKVIHQAYAEEAGPGQELRDESRATHQVRHSGGLDDGFAGLPEYPADFGLPAEMQRVVDSEPAT